MKIARRLHFETMIKIRGGIKPFCPCLSQIRIKYTEAVLIGICAVGLLNTRAEVGDLYTDSVRKHGTPLAKMVMKDHTIYLFQGKDSPVREVYNLEGQCIESDFTSTEPTRRKLFQPKSTSAPTSIPATALEPVMDSPKEFSSFFRVLLISLSGLAAAVALIFILKKRPRPLPDTILLPIEEGKKTDRNEKTKTAHLNPCHKEAAFRLSRNEMSLFKALNEAAGEDYIVTYHISFDRIIDILAPRFSDYLSTYRGLKPLFVDFVLHHPGDTSVAAVILLQDSHSEQAHQKRCRKFIHDIMITNNMPLLEIPVKHKYDAHKLKAIISEADKQNATLTSDSHPFSKPISTVSAGF